MDIVLTTPKLEEADVTKFKITKFLNRIEKPQESNEDSETSSCVVINQNNSRSTI